MATCSLPSALPVAGNHVALCPIEKRDEGVLPARDSEGRAFYVVSLAHRRPSLPEGMLDELGVYPAEGYEEAVVVCLADWDDFGESQRGQAVVVEPVIVLPDWTPAQVRAAIAEAPAGTRYVFLGNDTVEGEGLDHVVHYTATLDDPEIAEIDGSTVSLHGYYDLTEPFTGQSPTPWTDPNTN